MRRRQLKKFMLVTPAGHWPHVDSGLSMRSAGTCADGRPLFCYAWSPNYAAAQRVFEQAQVHGSVVQAGGGGWWGDLAAA